VAGIDSPVNADWPTTISKPDYVRKTDNLHLSSRIWDSKRLHEQPQNKVAWWAVQSSPDLKKTSAGYQFLNHVSITGSVQGRFYSAQAETFNSQQVYIDYKYLCSTWSIFKGSPLRRRASAGTMSPSFMLMISPGTRITASCSDQVPSRST
jgi:hypothetical protein